MDGGKSLSVPVVVEMAANFKDAFLDAGDIHKLDKQVILVQVAP